ncbi:hypothetical protein LguiA_032812 [Lonicera macranthoides]
MGLCVYSWVWIDCSSHRTNGKAQTNLGLARLLNFHTAVTSAMNLTAAELLSICSSCSTDEDVLIKNILLAHDPDGRHLDSQLLLHAIMNVIRYVSSSQLRLKCFEDGDIHARTMVLIDMLDHYTWDAKVVLILAAFATNYGEFLLIMELCPENPMAASLAVLKQLPSDLSKLGPLFKALRLLINAMVEMTNCIIKFEGLPLQQMLLDYKEMSSTKSQICIATYWIFRSTLACCSLITDIPKKISKTRLLRNSETRLYMKLLNLFKETYADNQEVLHTLFAFKDALPLKDCCSQAKVDISELKDKVVILLVSKPELLPIEHLLLLVEQTYDHPAHKKEGSYEIVWVPIPSSDTWTLNEQRIYNFFSNSLPWFSIRQPCLLSSATVHFIKQEWNFKEDPLMVALDFQGRVINSNAIDMIFIWGAKAFPFSTTREKELWENETHALQLMIEGIDPLLMHRIAEDTNICICASDDLDWIREFNSRMKKIITTGLQLEVIYVGKRNPNKHIRNILAIIQEDNLSSSLNLTKIRIFWIRWESMIKSILHVGQTVDNDSMLTEVSGLLDMDDSSKGWVLIGKGSSKETVKLQGRMVLECFDNFSVWGENVAELGLAGAIRAAHQPPLRTMPCDNTNVIAYDEGKIEETVVCDKCKLPMEKYVIYKCEVTE